jgi:hypothetical protein
VSVDLAGHEKHSSADELSPPRAQGITEFP